jgi:hypothetical protein
MEIPMRYELGRIHWPAVLVAAVAHFMLGALWYALLFAEVWMGEMGLTVEQIEAEGGASTEYLAAFLAALVAAVVLALLIAATRTRDAAGGALLGLLVGIGFLVTASGNTALFAGESATLWAINTGYPVVGYALMGAILGAWQKREGAPASPA